MMSSTDSPSDDALGDIYVLVAEKMAAGASEAEIRIFLMGHGFGYDEACRILSELENARGEVDDDEARALMRHGVLWLISGCVLTYLSQSTAGGDGVYFFFWGAIVYGAWLYFHGSSKLRPPHEESPP
jgi:hypothetical protein